MCALVLDDDGRVLLARRKFEPEAGKWDVPGGFLEEDEEPLDGLRRELREEAGVEIEPLELAGIWADRYGGADDATATLNLYWTARIVSGEPTPADDVAELRWFLPRRHTARRGNRFRERRRRRYALADEAASRRCRSLFSRWRPGPAPAPRSRSSCSGSPAIRRASSPRRDRSRRSSTSSSAGSRACRGGRSSTGFLPQLTPIPMLHLGIGGPGAVRVARISMQQIANGQGDAYLVHLNKAINGFGSLVYVRPMAEMNSDKALYNSSRGAGIHAAGLPARLRPHLPHPPRRPAREDRCRPQSTRAPVPHCARGSSAQPQGEAQGDLEPASRGMAAGARFYPGDRCDRPRRQRHVQPGRRLLARRERRALRLRPRAQEAVLLPRVGRRRRPRRVRAVHLRLHQVEGRRSSSPPTSTARPDRGGTSARSRAASRPTGPASRRSS